MKLALYGGSFDPVHFGHLILAREAVEVLSLDKVIFIPAAQSPHKMTMPPAPAADRLQMLKLAIQGEERFEIDDLELHRPAPSYTIDTIRTYRRRYPESELFYLLGSDNWSALDTWYEIDQLKREIQFLWLGREHSMEHEPKISRRIDITSTEIRNRVANGQSIRYLLPEKACEVIYQKKLYHRRPS